MKTLCKFVLMIFMLSGIYTVAVSGVNMQPGNWEITVHTKVKGVRGPFGHHPLPPTVYNTCLTKKDMNPQKDEGSSNCKTISSSVKGNTYTWEMKCKSSGTVSHSWGKITYRGTTFSGSVTTVTNGMKMTQRMTGRRTGPCK